MSNVWGAPSRIWLRLQVLFFGIAFFMWVFLLLVRIYPSFPPVLGFTFLNGNLSAIPFATIWPRLASRRDGAPWPVFLVFLVVVAVVSSSLATFVFSRLHLVDPRDSGLRTFLVGILITLVTGVVTRASEHSRRELVRANQLLEQQVAVGEEKLDEQRADLRAAHEIQARLLPTEMPTLPQATVACAWRPAQSVGGDYFDVLPLASGKVAFCMADVCGKGISAALLMASVQAAFRAFAPESADVGALCARLNRTLCEVTGPARFVTFFCGVFDPRSRMFAYENAGHARPLLLRGDGVEVIDGGGMVLGMFPEAAYESRVLQLATGDRILLATDGILEATGESGEEFGEGRLAGAAQAAEGMDAAGIKQRVMTAVEEFCAGVFEDDASLMVIVIG